MKQTLITSTLALTTAALFAGEPAPYIEAAPMSPPPQPSLLNWFAGGSVGYLFDNEEELYTGHLGFDLPNQAFGATQSIFLEVGYTEFDESTTSEVPDFTLEEARVSPTGEVAFGGFGSIPTILVKERLELEIIPITLNYKLERPLTQQLSGYLGAGAGVALLDLKASVDPGSSDSDDDTVFYAQVFAGLVYNVSEAFEIFGGARWIYLDDSEFSLFKTDIDADSDDDIAGELGFRFNF